ncbi:MAG: rhomboid family intrarane serine protease [Bacteroidetes bacterium]|nr:rhomboid family intrarane serine protease [Bacteroidota bacterium]
MIPIRDTTKSKSIPIVNYILITLCGIVFLFEVSLSSRLELLVFRFGVIPVDVSMLWLNHQVSVGTLLTLVTSLFLHGGWLHLIGNMLYLYIFGDNVEDRLGHGPYLIFYLLCGIGASIVQVYSNQHSTVPLIGASGAIAGVLGAYFLLYPKARILTVIPLFIFFPVVELSAFFFLGFWFVMQFLQGSLSSGADVGGGVAWWAHAGGFLVGAALLPIFLLWKRM